MSSRNPNSVEGLRNELSMLRRIQAPPWVGYASALIVEGLVTLGLLVLGSGLPLYRYPIPYVLAVMLVAHLFGEGPALLSFFAGIFAYGYFFVPPMGSFLPLANTPMGWAGWVAFLIGTSIVGFFTIMMRRSRRGIQQLLSRVETELSERKQAEAAISAAEQRFRVAVNHLPFSLAIYDMDLRLQFVNSGWLRLTRLSLQQAVGHRDDELFTSEVTASYLPYLEACRDSQSEQTVEYELGIPDEHECLRTLVVTYTPLADPASGSIQILAVGQDVTESRLSESVLQRYRLLSQHARDIIIFADPDGYILEANEAAVRKYGYAREELLNMSVYDIRTPDAAANVVAQLAEARKHGILFETTHRRKDGSTFPAEVSSQGAEINGRPALLSIIRDITERKMAEKRERELEDHKLDFYRRTILAATGDKLFISDRDEIERVTGSPVANWEILRADDMPGIRREISAMCRTYGMSEASVGRLAICLGEIATNAIKHADVGSVSLHLVDDSVVIKVSDDGEGIPALNLPELALRDNYSTAGTLGMGYKILLLFGDRVYLSTGPEGTTVAVQMKLHQIEHRSLDADILGLPV